MFIVVGLTFLFTPQMAGDSLNRIAQLLGLTGEITTPPGTLWYVLTLSLMGTIALLAFTSAAYPQQKILYKSLVLAKSISVAGFLVLAANQGSAWLLCAIADAFVAGTLVLSYPSEVFKDMTAGFARQMAGAPHYEVWFGKIDVAPGRAFWFRYTILDGVKKEASAWAIYFDQKITTGKNSWPLSDLAPPNTVIIPETNHIHRFRGKPQVFHLGNAHLDTANALGKAGDISWDIEFTDNGHRFEHVPPLVKFLKVAKSNYYACFLDLRFSGIIKNGPEVIEIKDKPGMIGHIHGQKSAHSWAWAHCNNFDTHQNVVFEGLSARIPLGGKVSKPLSSFILIVDGKRYEFSSLKKMLTSDSEFSGGNWEFGSRAKGLVLKGKATAPENVALVEYTDTDDSKLWCHNSKMGSLKIELTHTKTGKTQVFESKNTAAFEIVNRLTSGRRPDL